MGLRAHVHHLMLQSHASMQACPLQLTSKALQKLLTGHDWPTQLSYPEKPSLRSSTAMMSNRPWIEVGAADGPCTPHRFSTMTPAQPLAEEMICDQDWEARELGREAGHAFVSANVPSPLHALPEHGPLVECIPLSDLFKRGMNMSLSLHARKHVSLSVFAPILADCT